MLPRAWARGLKVALFCVTVGFYLLAFVHLRADFPNGSPWNDWSKTTDEGWYAGGAVHHVLMGRWYQPGAFNPAVVMPVWPAMAGLWFRAAGFGMVQLRVLTLLLTGLSLLMFYRLVRQSTTVLPALLGTALLAANPFVYSFSRLSVLEPVMIFFLLLALVLAAEGARRGNDALCCAAGLSLAALVLTKTTGLALVPGALFFVWMSQRQRGASEPMALRSAALAAAGGLAAWAAYYFAAVRRYAADYSLLFHINQDRVHRGIVLLVGWHTLRDGMWIGPLLYPLAVMALLAAVLWLHELWHEPLFGAAVLIALGYLAFIAYHTNLQPRYYLLVTPALVMVLMLTLHQLTTNARVPWAPPASGAALKVFAGLLAVCLLSMAARTVRYATHPQYTYFAAAMGVSRAIAADPAAHRLAIGNQGDTLSLWTGVPAICEQYSTDNPETVLQSYRPGWFMAILGAKPNAMLQQLQRTYRLQPRATYQVFDDLDRHTLVLYRLLPR